MNDLSLPSLFGSESHASADVVPQLFVLGHAVPPLYPMEAATKWHYAHHLGSVTDRWMDTAMTGTVAGRFHRVLHGHDLVADGLKVLKAESLSFGHFLHHLGLDSLTKSGVPVPLISNAALKLGVSERVASEWLSVSIPKMAGGSLVLLVSGDSVLAAYSDAIPHTFTHAALHAGYAAADFGLGWIGANPMMMAAGAAETLVSGVTAYRAFVDPIVPALGVPFSVYVPNLLEMTGVGVAVGALSAMACGRPNDILPRAASGGVAGAAALTTKLVATAHGAGYHASFLGPVAGLASYLLVYNLLKPEAHQKVAPIQAWEPLFDRSGSWNTSSALTQSWWNPETKEVSDPRSFCFTLPRLDGAPIGRILTDGRVEFDREAIERCWARS